MNIKDVKQIGVRIGGPRRAAAPIDANVIRELAELLTETGLTEIEVEQNGQRVRVARHGGHFASSAVAAPEHTSRSKGHNFVCTTTGSNVRMAFCHSYSPSRLRAPPSLCSV